MLMDDKYINYLNLPTQPVLVSLLPWALNHKCPAMFTMFSRRKPGEWQVVHFKMLILDLDYLHVYCLSILP